MNPLRLLAREDEAMPASRPSGYARRRPEDVDDEASSARGGTATFLEMLERAYSEVD